MSGFVIDPDACQVMQREQFKIITVAASDEINLRASARKIQNLAAVLRLEALLSIVS